LHAETAARGCNGQVAVAETAHEIKRFARRLLVREAHRVVRDLLLDDRAHLRRGAKESVGRHEARERLVRSLKVVRLHEEVHASHAVGEIRKDGLRQKLVPERFPEALNLAERLRVLRAAFHVLDAFAAQLFFEFRRAAPRRVLATLVRQNLAWRAVVFESALERVHHELALLMMRERVRHDEARVVVHEAREIEALVTT
jgi:hypothetical protein